MTADRQPLTDAPSLLAIAKAAHQTGNCDLERAARQLLKDHHGIEVTFRRGTGIGLSMTRRTSADKGGDHDGA
jgi:hypothetical protein